MTPPNEFGLTAEEKLEKERGYYGLSMRDRTIIHQLIDNVPIDEILSAHGIAHRTLKNICSKRTAIAYREYHERLLLMRYGYTRENVIRGLCDIAFTRMDDIAQWTNTEVLLKDSEFLSSAAKNAISEVQASYFKGEKVVKVKMHDKLAALNALMKTFEGEDDNDMDRRGLEALMELLKPRSKENSAQDHGERTGEEKSLEAEPGPANDAVELSS